MQYSNNSQNEGQNHVLHLNDPFLSVDNVEGISIHSNVHLRKSQFRKFEKKGGGTLKVLKGPVNE